MAVTCSQAVSKEVVCQVLGYTGRTEDRQYVDRAPWLADCHVPVAMAFDGGNERLVELAELDVVEEEVESQAAAAVEIAWPCFFVQPEEWGTSEVVAA